jgi:hypothetical protein
MLMLLKTLILTPLKYYLMNWKLALIVVIPIIIFIIISLFFINAVPRAPSAVTIVPPTNFVFDVLDRNSLEQRETFMKGFKTVEERNEFLKNPTTEGMLKLFRGLREDDLTKFFRSLTSEELRYMSTIISKNEREEILNRFSNSTLHEEISNKLITSSK